MPPETLMNCRCVGRLAPDIDICQYRRMSKSRARAHPRRDRRLLLAADPRAARRRAGRADRAAAQGAGRPGPAPAALAGRLARRRRGLRLRPQRRLRPVPADDQPPPQAAPRGRAARPREARRLGLLPGATPAALGDLAALLGGVDRRDACVLRRAVAELVGTAFLVAAVVGSGIAAQRLSPDDVGLQLLENSIATGAVLVALILALQPVSASFNPVVTLVERVLGRVDHPRPPPCWSSPRSPAGWSASSSRT